MSLPQGFVATADAHPHPLQLVGRDSFDGWRQRQAQPLLQWLTAHGFDGASGSALVLPGGDGNLASAVLGIGDPLDPWSYAHAPYALPPGDWQVDGDLDADMRRALQLGWGLGAYRYNRFRDPPRAPARLVLSASGDGMFDEECVDVLAACLRVRDLVNTPTEQLGPDQLEQIVREIGERHGAQIEVISGDDLLTRNFPAIHAVGRGASRAAADRAALGCRFRSAHCNCRQGCVLRHRRAQHQDCRRHAQHEEGHGRRRARDRAGRIDHGAQAAVADHAAGARVGERDRPGKLSARRRGRHAQGPVRGDRPHRRRRPRHPRRCAHLRR